MNSTQKESDPKSESTPSPSNTASPTKAPDSKKTTGKKPMNFGDCGHPANSVQQFGFGGGH